MRRILLAALAVVFAASLAAPLQIYAQGAPPQVSADQPYTIEYYYKCQWGHQAEFMELFLKNHYPLLKKIQSTGRILSVKIESPAYHTSEDCAGTTASPSATKTPPWPPQPTPTKRPSSRSYGLTRQLTRKKNSAALKFSPATGICRSPTSRRQKSNSKKTANSGRTQLSAVFPVLPQSHQVFRRLRPLWILKRKSSLQQSSRNRAAALQH